MVPLVIAADAWVGDQFGGQYKVASELAVWAAARGRDVHYLCPGPRGAPEMAIEHGVTIWRYASSGSNPVTKLFAHLKGAEQALRRASDRLGRPFIFNGHGPLPYYAGLRCRELPISRRVMSIHSPLAAEYRANADGGLALAQRPVHAFFRHVERACYSQSDVLQCFSSYVASLLDQSMRPKVAICPGYVDYGAMSIDLSRAEARSRLGLPCWQTGEMCFFSLRRHARRMGLDNLVRAFAWLKEEHSDLPRCRLILGGEGPQTPILRGLASSLGIQDQVHFVGKIDENAKALHYRAADCFVLPTLALEGFGLIVLEAFAAGTPVIATPVGAIPEVVDGFGALTTGTDERALGREIARFLTHCREPDGMEEARLAYARSFDKALVLPRLEALIAGEAS